MASSSERPGTAAAGGRRAAASEPSRVESPCVQICTIDPDSGYCIGCRRTLAEIAGWLAYSEAERHAVLGALALRDVG